MSDNKNNEQITIPTSFLKEMQADLKSTQYPKVSFTGDLNQMRAEAEEAREKIISKVLTDLENQLWGRS